MQLLTLSKNNHLVLHPSTSSEGGLQSSFLISHFKKLHLLKAAFICSDNKHNYWQREKTASFSKEIQFRDYIFNLLLFQALHTPDNFHGISWHQPNIPSSSTQTFEFPGLQNMNPKKIISYNELYRHLTASLATYSADEICVF